MANDIVSNVIDSEKFKQNELNYFASIICSTITQLETILNKHFADDHRIRLLISIKDKWVETFNSMIN